MKNCSALLGSIEGESIASSNGDTEANGTWKKTEENLFNGLHLICKALRGAAEILGDKKSINEIGDSKVLSSSRNVVIKQLTKEDAELVETLRYEVLVFLTTMSDNLVSSNGDDSKNSINLLTNSFIIWKEWMKVLKVTLTQRSACLKNVDQISKWFKMNKKMMRPIMVKAIQRTISMNNLTDSPDPRLNNDYWAGHDVNTNNVSNLGWLQLARRNKEFSLSSLRQCLKDDEKSPLYLLCLGRLATLCGHEYDTIRSKAQTVFESISVSFGMHVQSVIIQALSDIKTTNVTSFHTLSGALSILGNNQIMKRITGQWNNISEFLSAVASFPTIVANIPDIDKREKLMKQVAHTFVKYLGRWNHVPLSDNEKSNASALLSYALSQCKGAETSEGTQQSNSLRHDTFTSFIVLHMIGHNDIPTTPNVWSWSLYSLMNTLGPTQLIGLSAISKLTYTAYISGIDPVSANILRDTLSTPTSMQLLLQSVSLCHPTSNDSQWSSGIDHVLRSTDYIKTVLPRQISNLKSDRHFCSSCINKQNCGFFMTLPVILHDSLMKRSTESEETVYVVFVQSLLLASQELKHSTEEENRANNGTRAELFGGLFKSLVVDANKISSPLQVNDTFSIKERNIKVSFSDATRIAIEKILVSYFFENVDKVSVEFNKDWAEALYFASGGRPTAIDGLMATTVLENLKTCLAQQQSLSLENKMEQEGDEKVSSDGFRKQDKILTIVRALVVSDTAVTGIYSIPTSEFGMKVLEIFEKVGCVSDYRSTRVEIASILGSLTQIKTDSNATYLNGVAQQLNSISSVDEIGNVIINDPKFSSIKNAIETVIFWIQFAVQTTDPSRYLSLTVSLLPVCFWGCSHPEVELYRNCQETCLLVFQTLTSTNTRIRNSAELNNGVKDALNEALQLLAQFAVHPAWHVKETAIYSASIFMHNNWSVLSTDEKVYIIIAIINITLIIIFSEKNPRYFYRRNGR
jgi:hypothetical protein